MNKLQGLRREEMKEVFRIIASCDFDELLEIVEEIRCVHNCFISWDKDGKMVKRIASVSLNGESIQMNCEVEE